MVSEMKKAFNPFPVMTNREIYNIDSPEGVFRIPVRLKKKIEVNRFGYERVVIEDGEAYMVKEVWSRI